MSAPDRDIPGTLSDAEWLDLLALYDLLTNEPGQEPPRPYQPAPPEPEFDIDEWEEWDGSLPWDDEAAEWFHPQGDRRWKPNDN